MGKEDLESTEEQIESTLKNNHLKITKTRVAVFKILVSLTRKRRSALIQYIVETK